MLVSLRPTQKTPSSFDRTVEPEYGESPEIILPTVWKETLSSGIKLIGIENYEVPLVEFKLQLKGGY
jgi:zinc protease